MVSLPFLFLCFLFDWYVNFVKYTMLVWFILYLESQLLKTKVSISIWYCCSFLPLTAGHFENLRWPRKTDRGENKQRIQQIISLFHKQDCCSVSLKRSYLTKFVLNFSWSIDWSSWCCMLCLVVKKVKKKVKWCIYIAPFPCNMLKGALQWSLYPQRTGSIYRRLWQPLQIGPCMLVLVNRWKITVGETPAAAPPAATCQCKHNIELFNFLSRVQNITRRPLDVLGNPHFD